MTSHCYLVRLCTEPPLYFLLYASNRVTSAPINSCASGPWKLRPDEFLVLHFVFVFVSCVFVLNCFSGSVTAYALQVRIGATPIALSSSYLHLNFETNHGTLLPFGDTQYAYTLSNVSY